jgi:hypothetical protein
MESDNEQVEYKSLDRIYKIDMIFLFAFQKKANKSSIRLRRRRIYNIFPRVSGLRILLFFRKRRMSKNLHHPVNPV